MISLTASQADCARVIAELTALEGFPPTLDEVGREMDIGRSEARRLADCLEERGWLMPRRPGEVRGLRLACVAPPLPRYEVGLTEAGREEARAA